MRMNRYLLAAAMIVMGGAAAQAQSTDGRVSLSVLGGWSAHPALTFGPQRADVNDGFNVGARLGYDMNDMLPWSGFSLDADYFYNQANYGGANNDAQLGSSSYMADITYHLPLNPQWNVYGGGGLGAVHYNLNGALHGSSTVFGWQALGGVEYQYSPDMAMFAEYRYQNAHDANIAGGPVGNTSNNLSMGLKFKL